jgi:hypothetical protein
MKGQKRSKKIPSLLPWWGSEMTDGIMKKWNVGTMGSLPLFQYSIIPYE